MKRDSLLWETRRGEALRLGMPEDALFVLVQASVQCMLAGCDWDGLFSYPVSTAAAGLGEVVDSGKTPRGFHEITERYGAELPPGAVLTSRLFTGEVLSPDQWQQSEGDKILTRILRLAGREAGRNAGGEVDSYNRMIYIHGTNQEQWVGVRPASHGCIRMRNLDVVAFYDFIRNRPCWVWIGA